MGAANGIKPLSERHFAGTRSRIFSYVYQHFFVRVGSSIRRYDKNFYLKMGRFGRFCCKVVARSLVGGRKGQSFCNKKGNMLGYRWYIVAISLNYRSYIVGISKVYRSYIHSCTIVLRSIGVV